MEAYIKAKNKKKDLKCDVYSEFQDKYYFCLGDPNFYVTVDKNTGEVRDFNVMDAYFGESFDSKYCEGLSNALNSNKDIPTAKSIVKAS